MNVINKLVIRQSKGSRIAHSLLALFGVEIPVEVNFKNINSVCFVHRSPGLVLDPSTQIGDSVWLFQNVTIGKARPEKPYLGGGVVVGDQAIICAGAVVLFRDNQTIEVKRGTILGANSVLTCSTGENEIWAGIPAKRIGFRSE